MSAAQEAAVAALRLTDAQVAQVAALLSTVAGADVQDGGEPE